MTDAYVFEAREEKDVFTSDGKEYVTPMYSYNPKGNKVIENTDPKRHSVPPNILQGLEPLRMPHQGFDSLQIPILPNRRRSVRAEREDLVQR